MQLSVARHLIVSAGIAVLAACAAKPVSVECRAQSDQVVHREVAEALSRYELLLRAQDSSAIAQMFVPNGRLEHVGQDPIVGREKIQSFLASFARYKILSHEMNLSSSTYTPCRANQSGTYVQHVLAPDGQEITARGWFLFQWEKQPDGRWLLESGRTSSSPILDGT